MVVVALDQILNENNTIPLEKVVKPTHGGWIICFRCGGPNHKPDSYYATDEEVERYQSFLSIQARDAIDKTWYMDTRANQHMAPNTTEA